jgi:uncharacterized protein (TIGR02996 family)
MSHEAFLREICEHPDDEAPRLIYADWLEENGQPERAEFIRAQVEVARYAPNDPRRGALRPRIEELSASHGNRWRAELPGLPGVSWQRFWRGFVSGATFELWKHYRASAAQAFAATPIQFLRMIHLNHEQITEWARSPLLARLQGLELNGHRTRDGHLRVLASCPFLTELRVLVLRGGYPGGVGRPWRFAFGWGGLDALVASPHLTQLKTLQLAGMWLRPGMASRLRERFGQNALVGCTIDDWD